MTSPLEKTRRDPGSMKARILISARKLFGEYSYHATTTRSIFKDVIDISTRCHHRGEKIERYHAVITDINEKIRNKRILIPAFEQDQAAPSE